MSAKALSFEVYLAWLHEQNPLALTLSTSTVRDQPWPAVWVMTA
jgi:hypothetical protein